MYNVDAEVRNFMARARNMCKAEGVSGFKLIKSLARVNFTEKNVRNILQPNINLPSYQDARQESLDAFVWMALWLSDKKPAITEDGLRTVAVGNYMKNYQAEADRWINALRERWTDECKNERGFAVKSDKLAPILDCYRCKNFNKVIDGMAACQDNHHETLFDYRRVTKSMEAGTVGLCFDKTIKERKVRERVIDIINKAAELPRFDCTDFLDALGDAVLALLRGPCVGDTFDDIYDRLFLNLCEGLPANG
jgi:hypothetical protein